VDEQVGTARQPQRTRVDDSPWRVFGIGGVDYAHPAGLDSVAETSLRVVERRDVNARRADVHLMAGPHRSKLQAGTHLGQPHRKMGRLHLLCQSGGDVVWAVDDERVTWIVRGAE